MPTYIYDGSFEGLLTCIFTMYQNKTTANAIVSETQFQPLLFDDSVTIITDELLATRVLRGLETRTHKEVSDMLYKMFLSELPAVEMDIAALVDAIVADSRANTAKANTTSLNNTTLNSPSGSPSILQNFANPAILKAAQIVKMMQREIHRMHAFVRFQKGHEGIFHAVIEPDFNVLPLIGEHFERRYADQPWIIFDARRHFGLYYNLTETIPITRDDPILATAMGDDGEIIVDGVEDGARENSERLYQQLWRNYFRSVNIPARNNVKLHLRQLPKRYWKYLTEKNHLA